MNLTKAETFKLAKDYNFLQEVIDLSHTCYEGDRIHKNEENNNDSVNCRCDHLCAGDIIAKADKQHR